MAGSGNTQGKNMPQAAGRTDPSTLSSWLQEWAATAPRVGLVCVTRQTLRGKSKLNQRRWCPGWLCILARRWHCTFLARLLLCWVRLPPSQAAQALQEVKGPRAPVQPSLANSQYLCSAGSKALGTALPPLSPGRLRSLNICV